MSTGSILSILTYPQYGYHLVYHTGLSIVHCSYLSVGSLHRVPTPPLRRHNYLPENANPNWARQAVARTGIQAPRKEVRSDPAPANAGGNQTNDSPLFHPVSSSSSSDVPDAGEGCEAIIGTLPSPAPDPTESPHFRIPLAIQLPSKMNTHHGWDLRGRGGETQDVKVGKRGAPSDSEDWED